MHLPQDMYKYEQFSPIHTMKKLFSFAEYIQKNFLHMFAFTSLSTLLNFILLTHVLPDIKSIKIQNAHESFLSNSSFWKVPN